MRAGAHHIRAEQLDNDAGDVDLFRISEVVEAQRALREPVGEELRVEA